MKRPLVKDHLGLLLLHSDVVSKSVQLTTADQPSHSAREDMWVIMIRHALHLTYSNWC